MSKAAHPRYLDGAALRRERIAAGLEQAQLADRVGATQGQVSGWERGHTGCRLGKLHELANALNIPPSRLLRPEEDQDAEDEPEETAA